MPRDLFKTFDKCANYATLITVAYNTLNTMARFKNVSREMIITNLYNKTKQKAAMIG